MDLLILGGTGFLSGEIARAALADGHTVTCFARGSRPAPVGADLVTGDREDDDALTPLSGRHFDAIVEITSQPGRAKRAVRDLDTDHWVFVSTANVYTESPDLERDEDAPLQTPLGSDVLEGMEDYGAAKVACEQIFSGSGRTATLVRSGLIGGDGDASGRTGYWPWRFAHPVDGGPDVVVPDDPDFPCAVVDVRDLADFCLRAAVERLEGPFNVTGPTVPLSEVLATANEVAGSNARPLPVAPERLRELGVNPWMGPRSLPMWIDVPEIRGFATMDTTRARAAGLTTRPLAETLAAALAYEESREGDRPSGLTDEVEREVLAAVRGA